MIQIFFNPTCMNEMSQLTQDTSNYPFDDEEKFFGLQLVFQALGNHARLEIVELLSVSEASLTDLAVEFEMSKSQMSYHIRLLKRADLITTRVIPTGGTRFILTTRGRDLIRALNTIGS
jgi:predicted transcriptional regulator